MKDQSKTGLDMLYIYPEHQSDRYGKNQTEVSKKIWEQLQMKGEKDYEFLGVHAVGTKKLNDFELEEQKKQGNNSGYDLNKVFNKIKQMTPDEIHAIGLASVWGPDSADSWRRPSQDNDSKLKIINDILKTYPEFAGKFISFNTTIGHPELEKHGYELFSPSLNEEWTTARLITEMGKNKNKIQQKNLLTKPTITGTKGIQNNNQKQ